MRLLHILAVFISTIFASVLFVFKTHRAGEELLSLYFQQEQITREVNCSELLDELSPPFPAVLIDLQLLKGLKDDDCRSGMQKIRVAVDVQYLNDVRKADFPGYNIIYYDKSRYKDFLLFFDTESRILPRVSFSVYGNFSIPLDVERFLEFWNRSELVDCIGLKVSRATTNPYLPVEKTLQTMSSLVKYLVSFNVYPFLNGGTLLGWYRECGIIPHTYDVDFAAFIGEYNPQLLEHLQSNETKFFLSRKFGRADDSFEFTLRPLGGGRPMMDLFWMYTSANESWVGGTSRDGTKYKYSYPRRIRICAGDLLGHIFWVPCDPETIIVTEYGPEWYKDHPTSKFSWSSSHFNVRKNGRWTKEEMKEIYKIF